MRLKTEIALKQARLKDLKIVLSEEDPKITIGVRAKLTHAVAEEFGCRELIYVNDTPRSGVEKMKLDGEEIDVDVRLENDAFAFCAVANKMGDFTAKFEGTGPVLEFKLHFTGYADLLTDVATKVKVDPLTVTIRPAQIPLDLKEKDTGCIACNNEIPLVDGDPTLHMSGQPCTAQRPAESEAEEAGEPAESEGGPALASVTEIGKPGRRSRRGRTGRQLDPEQVAADQAAAAEQLGSKTDVDFMEDLVGNAEPVIN